MLDEAGVRHGLLLDEAEPSAIDGLLATNLLKRGVECGHGVAVAPHALAAGVDTSAVMEVPAIRK